MSDYVIAIPSYKRSTSIAQKSLATIRHNKIDPKRVHIFVANEDEFKDYDRDVPKDLYGKLIVAEPTLLRARNFITRYFPVGQKIWCMDDDIVGYRFMIRDFKGGLLEKDLYAMPSEGLRWYHGKSYEYCDKSDNIEQFIELGFKKCEETGAHLFGFYPTTDSIAMSCSITTDLKFIMGASWGYINPGDIFNTLNEKEDYERTILYYDRYKHIVRINFIGIATDYMNPNGGMTALQAENSAVQERSRSLIEKSAKELESRFPQYCHAYLKTDSRGEHWDIRLRHTKPKAVVKGFF